MKKIKIFFILLSISMLACQQEINIDSIERKDGLIINNETSKPLHGRYKCTYPIGGTYSGNHIQTFEYHNGIQIGEWTYTFNGDLIHNGKYLNEDDIKANIWELTKSKRTELHLWQEGNYVWLDINLIEPQNSTPLIQTQIVQFVKDKMTKKYDFNEIRIQALQDDNLELLYEEQVKELQHN